MPRLHGYRPGRAGFSFDGGLISRLTPARKPTFVMSVNFPCAAAIVGRGIHKL
jgi:hypothetical protein